jgi:4-hydroxy-3-polyprenylbenzoate decarboxylase
MAAMTIPTLPSHAPHQVPHSRRIVVALTGASGAPYAKTLLRALGGTEYEVHVTVSDGFLEVARVEDADAEKMLCGAKVDLRGWVSVPGANFHYHHHSRIGASIASGSFRTEGMIVAPCSISTLGNIAAGTGKTLVERAADVTMKEGRRMALLLRESPLSAVALENALKLARLGVHIVPCSPAFYTKPQTIQDIVDHTVARTLDLFGIAHGLSKRWGEGS